MEVPQPSETSHIFDDPKPRLLALENEIQNDAKKRLFQNEIETTEISSVQKGSWEFIILTKTTKIVDDKNGRTLYHFIKGILEKKIPNLPQSDQLPYIDSIIEICRQLNPELDLDDFKKLNGKTIYFPGQIQIKPFFSEKTKNYSYLRDLAILDGFPIKNPTQRQKIYDRALKNGIAIPKSEYFFRKIKKSEDSPAKMESDAVQKFQAIAQDFFEKTGGWKFCYSDVLRNPTVQKTRAAGTRKGSTHLTGRSLDIPDGRFRDPGEKEITWTGNPEYRKKIEDEFRPLIKELFLKHGATVFVEGAHFHIYFPKERILSF
ncbi:MAG: hypothetical protein K9M51_01080 [Candidatus Gracilibacteria bacterium]|nr:hypothetical protein [Candidatus Gracilibacteria bacterium]